MRNLKNEAAIFALLLLAMQSVFADFVHLDDVIIDGSACVGFDCVNNESFGFDTLRVKENNLRVHFDDTSTTASFPRNDWRIVINDSANGGANYYAIEDATAGRQPFRIEAGARANALYVSNNGRVGFGTSTPVVDAHVVSGNTPTLRLEQDGTSGFTPQTWDVAGNEANFFIRDATNESRLPFRIFPGGPTDTLTLSGDGDVGIGTDSPDASLHILRTSGTPSIILETTNSNPEVQWEIKANESTGRLTIKELNGGATPFKFAHNAAENLLRAKRRLRRLRIRTGLRITFAR